MRVSASICGEGSPPGGETRGADDAHPMMLKQVGPLGFFDKLGAKACGAQPRKMPSGEPSKKICHEKIQSRTPKLLPTENFEDTYSHRNTRIIQVLLNTFES